MEWEAMKCLLELYRPLRAMNPLLIVYQQVMDLFDGYDLKPYALYAVHVMHHSQIDRILLRYVFRQIVAKSLSCVHSYMFLHSLDRKTIESCSRKQKMMISFAIKFTKSTQTREWNHWPRTHSLDSLLIRK